MTDHLATAATRRFGWIRWVVPAGLGLIGLLFLAYGLVNLSTQGWAHATGTVGACAAQVNGNGTGRTVHQICDVNWSADGVNHTASIDLGTGPRPIGHVDLRVNGDQALPADPVWVGIAATAGGLLLTGGAVVIVVRMRRAR